MPGEAGAGQAVPDDAVPAAGVPGGSARDGQAGTHDRADGMPGKPEMFRSPVAPVAWWLWLAAAVAVLTDLGVQSAGRASMVGAAAVLTGTGAMYVTVFRPRVIASGDALVVRNPLRDHRVPWPAVARVDIADLLRVHCAWQEAPGAAGRERPAGGPAPAGAGQAVTEPATRRKIIHVWAVQLSRRSLAAAELRAAHPGAGLRRRTGEPAPAAPEAPGVVRRKEIDRIARTLERRARAEREPRSAAGPIASWHWPSVAAVVLPVLLLAAAILA